MMQICNACRYCEGYCAVFPAMERRLAFAAADLHYLANLCHDCGACYHACQYAPPHEFAVNVPRVFAELRAQTYRDCCWPAFLAPLIERNGLGREPDHDRLPRAVPARRLPAGRAGGAVRRARRRGRLLRGHPAPRHGDASSAWSRSTSSSPASWAFAGSGGTPAAAAPKSPGAAGLGGAARRAPLRYLDGGSGDGCTYPTERPSQARRRFHHLTFYGFMLCFAATSHGDALPLCARLAGALPFPQPAGRARHARRHRPARRSRGPALAQAAGRPGAVRLPATRHGRGVSRAAAPDEPDRPAPSRCSAPRPRWACCLRCISA